MPHSQVATVETYNFGAKVNPADSDAAEVKRFRIRAYAGGKVSVRFENPIGENAITASVEVSVDGTTWAALTAANNGVVITDAAIGKRLQADYTFNVRATVDNYVRFCAAGGGQGTFQLRQAGILELVTNPNDVA